MRKIPPYRKNAFLLSCLVLCIALLCVGWIIAAFCPNRTGSGAETSGQAGSGAETFRRTADIYQNGTLLMSVPLDPGETAYTFTVTAGETDYNEIQVADGSIGVISATCPDKLCVHQGFQDSPLLPIVCLPNRLTIQIREEDDKGN